MPTAAELWGATSEPALTAGQLFSWLESEPTDQERLAYEQRQQLLSAREALSKSSMPDVTATVEGLASDIASPLARVLDPYHRARFGQDKGGAADYLVRRGDAYSQAMNEQDGEGWGGFLRQSARGVGRTVPATVLAGLAGGPYGAIGQAMLTEGNQAITEAKDAGMTPGQTAAYAASQALIEGTISAALQRVGLGGKESIFGKKVLGETLRGGLKEAAKQAGYRALQELPEEVLTEWGHAAARRIAEVDPNALSLESLKKITADTIGQTILTMGLMESPGLVSQGLNDRARGKALATAGPKREENRLSRAEAANAFTDPDFATNWASAYPEAAAAISELDKPSRSQWRQATGFRIDGNPTQRQAFAENVRMALARRQPAGREGEPVNDQGYRLNRDVRATAEAKAAQQQAPPPIPVEGATVPQFPTTQLSNEWTQIDASQPLPQSGVEVYRDRHGQTFVRAAGSTPQSAPMDANSGAQSRQATLEAMSIGELNQEASKFGIKKGPKKSKMIEKIMAAEAQVAPQISSPPPKPPVNQQIPKSPEGAALPAQPVGNVPTAGATTTPAPAQINAEAPITPQIASVEQPAPSLPDALANATDDELQGFVEGLTQKTVPPNPPKTFRARLEKEAVRLVDSLGLRDALSGQPQQQRPAARRTQQPDVPPATSPSMENSDAVRQEEKGRQEGLLTPAAQENPATPAPREERTSVRRVGADEKAAAHSGLAKAFPGSSITELPATNEHMGGYRVELPNGRFFDVLFLPQSALTDRTSIIKSLRGQLGRDPTEQEISEASAMGAFFVETKDGRKMPGLGAVALAVGNFNNTTIKHEGIHLARRIGLFTEAEWQALENKYAKGVRDRLTREGKTPQEIEDGVEEAIAYSTKAWDNSEPTLTEKIKAFFSTMLRAMGINPDARLVEVLMRSPEFWARNPTTQPDVQFTSDVRSNATDVPETNFGNMPPAAINPTPVNEVQTDKLVLRNEKPRKTAPKEVQPTEKQDKMFSGMDLLPGQQDLFKGMDQRGKVEGEDYPPGWTWPEYKKQLEQMRDLMNREADSWNTALHDVLGGADPHARAMQMRKVRNNRDRGNDAEAMKNFDVTLDRARKDYPQLLAGRYDDETNFIDNISKGFRERVTVNSPEVQKEAWKLAEASNTKTAPEGDSYEIPDDPVFGGGGEMAPNSDVPFQVAYHGSPHKFDRFTTQKMGTGEGAQAYGWGMYFAGKKEVADHYKQVLGGQGWYVAGSSSPITHRSLVEMGVDSDVASDVIRMLGVYDGDVREVISELTQRKAGGFIRPLSPRWNRIDEAIVLLRGIKSDKLEKRSGHGYVVDLKPAEDEYLLWDRPLSEQSEKVKAAIRKAFVMIGLPENGDPYWGRDPQGDQVISTLSSHFAMTTRGSAAKQTSLLLKELGVRGTKYLDNASRGSGTGSYNYVIFDDADVEIQGNFQVRSRANIGETGPVRRFVQEQDPTYNPENRPDEVPNAEASRRLKENGYEAERARLMRVAETGGDMNDTDVIVARRVFNAEAQEALKSGDSNAILGAQKVLEAYRRTGTEQGRAFRQRRDWQETPVDERRRTLAEAVLTPPTKTKEAIDNAMKEGNGAEAERLRRKWADEYKVLKKQLMLLGVDLDNLNAYGYDPVKAARALGTVRAAKADMWDKAYEYWRNAILSGTGTQVTNALGTAIHGGWKFLVERPLESVVNLAMRRPEGAQIGEFRHVAAGILPGLQRAARNAMTAWNTELPELERQLSKEAEWRIEEPNVAIKGNLGRWVRGGFIGIGGQRGMLAADDFMKSFFATLDVGAQAYRAAKAQGLTGDKMREFVAREVNDLKSTSWAKAHDTSLEVAFQQKGTKASRAAKRALLDLRRDVEVLGIKPLAFIFPFVTTPVNILETGLRKSPVTGDFAAMKKMYDNWRAGRSILTDMTPRLAERIVAWGTVLALSSLVGGDGDEPFITGTVDSKDRGQRDLSRRTFHPQSINIGGRWYSYSRVEPFATALALTVDWVNAGAKAKQTGDYTGIATTPFTSLFSQMKDKTFLDGVGDVMRIIEAPDPVEEMANWSSNFAVSWVPNIVRSTLRATSDTFPERGVWGEGGDKALRLGKRMLQRTELGIVKDQPAIDLWGREAKRGTSPIPHTDFLWRIMSPSESRIPELFIGDRAILNWNAKHPGEELLPSMPQRSIRVDGKQVALTDEQLTDYLKLSGTIAKGMVERLNIDPENPTEQTIDEIKSAIETARSRARDTLKMEWKGGPRMAPEAIITAEFNRDVNAKADVLTRLPPKRLLERRKWLAERAEALDWLKAKGVSRDAVIASYVPELKSIKTPKTRFQKRARLLRSLSSL